VPTAPPPSLTLHAMEPQHTEVVSLRLTTEECEALARILHVVEDEWWLDELERALLARLEPADAVLAAA
jgi:hypothetical protein